MAESRFQVKLAELLAPSPRGDRAMQTVVEDISADVSLFGLLVAEGGAPGLRARALHVFRSTTEALKTALKESDTPTRRFEEFLEQLNTYLLEDVLSSPQAPTLRAIMGVREGQQLFFSGTGEIHALYLHQTDERRFSIYELGAQFLPNERSTEQRPFFSLLDGELQTGDAFYAALPLPAGALKPEELHDILVTLPPEPALGRIRQYAAPQDGYCGIALRAMPERSLLSGLKKRSAAAVNSLQELQNLEDRTGEVLGEQTASPSSPTKLPAPGRRDAGALLLRLGTIFHKGLRGSLSATNSLLDRLPRTQRRTALLVGSGIAVIVLAVFFGNLFAKQRVADAGFDETVASITSQLDTAEASLLYHNLSEAQKATDNAAALLATLPSNNRDHSAQVEELRTRLNKLQKEARGEYDVALTQVTTASAPLSAFGVNGSTLVATGVDGSFYRFDSINRTLTKAANPPAETATALSGTITSENDIARYLGTNNQLFQVNTATSTTEQVASGLPALTGVADVALYNSTLYVLNGSAEQIVRMRAQLNGFETGTPWIISKERSIADARALTIDGDIYVATPTAIIKFRQGRELPWTVANLTLGNVRDLYTSTESKYLYVLDADGRIVVIEKETASLIAQYVSDTLKEAIGFSVDEAGKRITVATKDALLEFAPEHLL